MAIPKVWTGSGLEGETRVTLRAKAEGRGELKPATAGRRSLT